MRNVLRAFVLLSVASAPLAAEAQGWGYKFNEVYLLTNQTHTFFLANDLHTALDWAPLHDPTFQDFLDLTERSAQTWNAWARAPIAITISRNSVPNQTQSCPWAPWLDPPGFCVAFDESPTRINAVYHRDRPAWASGAGTRMWTNCFKPVIGEPDCDITIFTDTNITWNSSAGPVSHVGTFLEWGSADYSDQGGVERMFAHELGHALGLAHPNGCVSGSPGPLMCGGMRAEGWDFPSVDDIDGVRTRHNATVTRGVGLLLGSVDAVGHVTLGTTGVPNASMDSIARPRIACRNSTSFPDCVVTTVSNQNCGGVSSDCIRLTALADYSEAGGASPAFLGTLQATVPRSSRHDVDVAVSPTNQVALVTWMDAADRMVRWTTWDLDTGVVRTPTSLGVETRIPPRVTWHNLLSRFVLVFANPRRDLMVAVSTTGGAAGFSTPQRLAPTDPARFAYGSLDVQCPEHQGTDGYCRLVHADNGPYSSGTILAQNRNLLVTSGRFSVTSYGTVASSAWETSNRHAEIIGSIADYGANPPSGGWAGPGWLMLTSRRSVITDLNTGLIFSGNVAHTFTGAPEVDVQVFDIPVASGPKSMWGGLSCSYVRWTRKFACVQHNGGQPW